MNKKTTTIFAFFLFFLSLISNSQTVSISDQNGNNNIATPAPQINIDCNYNFVPPKKVLLTATFPVIQNATNYSVLPIAYSPIGLYNAGTPITISADDTWSSNIPIGFPFCFYGNNYSTLNVADNGIVRFGYNSSIIEGGFSSINNAIPSPSLIKNAIFAGFQDYLVSVGALGCLPGDNCGTITHYTTGVAPFRQMIINYNLVNHFGCSNTLDPINLTKSTFQVVLYETTNVIEIYVKDKPITCTGNSSANGGVVNSLIGLNNSDGTMGIPAPLRDTGVWSATDEAYRFTPSGSSTTVVTWFDNLGNPIGNINPIEVIPTINTFYTVKVKYNTCTPLEIQSQIDIEFDLNYPIAPNIIEKYCDLAPPFPDQSGIDVEALLLDPTDLLGTTKTIYNTQNEANAGSPLAIPLTGMNNYTMTSATQIFYYREEIGICFVTGKITLNLFQTPVIADQNLDICDAGNDGTETVNLSTLTNQIIGLNPSTMGIGYYQNPINANLGGTNTITSVPVSAPPGFFDVYIRVYNLLNPACFSVSKLTITILPNLVSDLIPTFCIPDPNFDGIVVANLTAIVVTNLNIPFVNPTYTYHTSLFNAQNNIQIPNPSSYNLAIQPAPAFSTIYIKEELPGYCLTIQTVNITICVPTGNGSDGGSGGNGGFGGAGFAACLNIGDQIPSFNLEALFNVVILPAAPVPTPTGYYTTLAGAQTQDPLVQLSAAQVANFVPTPLFSLIWVRYLDASNNPGIKRLVIPVKYKKPLQIITKELCDVNNDLQETINLGPTSPYIQEIQLLNPGETITCYPTQLDYDNNTNAIVAPFNFTLDFSAVPIEDTVYIRVSSYGCDTDYQLVFKLNPFIIQPPIDEKICDIAPFGSQPFPNLQTLINNIAFSYPTSTFSLHSTLNGAYDNSAIITNTVNYNVTPTTSVYIRIIENPILFPLACPTIQEITFSFAGSVLINSVAPLLVCDVDNDDKVVLSNLNNYVASIISSLNTDPINAQLYTTEAAALANDFAFKILPNWDTYEYNLNAFLPFSPNNSIWLYLQNTVTGCFRVVEIKLQMQSVVLPVLNNPLKICDYQNDNLETIANFNIFNTQVVPSSFLYNFEYFLSQADAIAGTPTIPANYVLANNTTVWIKILTSANAACSKIKDYVINFTQSPVVNNIQPKICDNLSDNLETINLNLYQSNVIPIPLGHTFQYYFSVANAISGSNQQSASYNMTFAANNLAVPIFVKVINNITQCYSIASIIFERELLIDAFDAQIFTCDISLSNTLEGIFDLTSIIQRTGTVGMIVNPLNYNITYHTDILATVANIILNPTAFTVLTDQTSYVYVKFVDKITNCFTIKRIELQIYQLPKFLDGEVFICDDNIDGVYSIDLNTLSSVVVFNPSPFTFGYFNSNADAVLNSNPITNLINYAVPLSSFPKSIFVKGTNANNCSKIREVILRKKPNIILISSDVSLLKCDANNNGLEIFNLTDANTLITNEVGVSFQYFATFADLQANSNAITNSINYPNLTNGQFIYVRLSKPATNCDSWARITLNAFYENYVFPISETLCDNNNDGTETLNLQQIVLGYIAPLTLIEVNLQFYNSLADANTGTAVGLIPNPLTYTFTNFSTDIFARLTNILTGCPIVKKINFLNPAPIILVDVQKEVCDFDRNNQETVNLSDYFQSMSVPLITSFTITSYLTEPNANTGTSAISSTNYLQTIPNQVYWIRFQDSNGCYSVKSITVQIIPLANPNLNPTTIEICDNTTPAVLSENFNLTTNENFIRNGNATNIVSYHTTSAFANAGTNAISVAQLGAYLVSGINNSVWIRVASNTATTLTNCAIVIEQKLLIVPIPTPNLNPTIIEICDNTTATVLSENFDINRNETFIRNGNTTDIMTYHTTSAFANAGTNAIPIAQLGAFPISGINNSVWIRVVSNVPNSLIGCAVIIEQKLLIVPIPTPRLNPQIIQLCDDLLSGDLKENFNLAANETFIRNGNSSYILTYFPTKPDAENNIIANQITGFGSYFSSTGSVWIRILSNTITTLQTCAIVIEQKLQVNPLPLAGTMPNLYSCINAGTIQATFNLNSRKIDVLAGQNPNYFSVTFHLLQADAKIGLNVLPTTYLSNSKIIYASVKNNLTGCRNTAVLQLVAETTTIATQPNANLTFVCDTDIDNDGFTKFKLSDLNAIILGTQSGVNYSINYYANQNDLNNNIELNQSAYKNITNPQTIIANVINTTSNVVPKKCASQINIVLKVNLLPETNPKDGFICKDQTSGELLSTYTINSELSDASHTFEWFLNSETTSIFGEYDSILEVQEAGDYTVTATQIAYPNCKSIPKKIVVTKSEPALATARVEYSFTENLNVLTIATGLGNYVYQLDDNDIQISNLFENVEPGTHQIAVIDKNGCATFYLNVIVLDYVRYFTPNSDNFNDTWNIRGIKDQPNAKVYIFDKYGKLLKQVIPEEIGWDGTYNGQLMPSDDYWFTVTYEENGEQKEFKSHFAMKR